MSTTRHNLEIQQPSAPSNALTKEDLRSLKISFGPYLEMHRKITKNPIDMILSQNTRALCGALIENIKETSNPFHQLYLATMLMAATGNVREIMYRKEGVYRGCSQQDFNQALDELNTFDEAIDTTLLPMIAKKILPQDIPDAVQLLAEMKYGKRNPPYITRAQKAICAYHRIPMPRIYSSRQFPGASPQPAKLTA